MALILPPRRAIHDLITLVLFGGSYYIHRQVSDKSRPDYFAASSVPGERCSVRSNCRADHRISTVTADNIAEIMRQPDIDGALVGAMAGALLFTAEKWNLFVRPGIQYFITIILGLSLAGLTYLLSILYKGDAMTYITMEQRTYILFVFLFIGFLIIFGYAFPERRFRQNHTSVTDIDT